MRGGEGSNSGYYKQKDISKVLMFMVPALLKLAGAQFAVYLTPPPQ